MNQDLEQELLLAFTDQINKRHEEINACKNELEKSEPHLEVFETLMRCFHSIKGSSRYLGFYDLSDYCHEIETTLSSLSSCDLDYEISIGDKILEANKILAKFLELKSNEEDSPEFKKLLTNSKKYFTAINNNEIEIIVVSDEEGEKLEWIPPHLEPADLKQQMLNLVSIIEYLNQLKIDGKVPEMLDSLYQMLFKYLPSRELLLEWKDGCIVCTPKHDSGILLSHILQEELLNLIELNPKKVIIDCSNLNAIFSSMIGTIVSIQKALEKKGGKLALAQINPQLMENLHSLKITEIIPCFKSLKNAMVMIQRTPNML